MLCYRCGSHVPDTADMCPTCGQKLAGGGVRQATATFSRRKLGLVSGIDGAPYKAGDVLLERYTIKDVVGAGPVGHVFRAFDRQIDVEVALKVINPRLVQTPEERKQFAKSIRVGRKLSHQNLVRVYEDAEDHDRPFFTMQFLDGLTLRKIIDLRVGKGQFFTLREVEPILGQIATAMDAAHKHGPHSDLKPENVIVLPDLLKVSDFGLGNGIPRLPFAQAVKQRRADVYLAPEYVQGGEIDQRADLYSLGVIVGEMLSGLVPDGSIPEILAKNSELPPQVEGLYRKALNANPLARPKTATEFFQEFSELTRRVSPPPLRPRSEPASMPRPRLSGVSAPLELVRSRPGTKPPPPVPEELLAEDPEATPSDMEELPPDATQPLESLDLPPPPPSASMDDATEMLPSMPPEPVQLPRMAALERIAGPSPFREVEEQAEPTSTMQRRNRATLWLMALIGGGLLSGALLGYWVLKHYEQPVTGDTNPKPEIPTEPPPAERPKVTDAEQRAAEERAEKEKRAAEQKAAEEKRLADLRAEKDKAAQDKAAQDAKVKEAEAKREAAALDAQRLKDAEAQRQLDLKAQEREKERDREKKAAADVKVASIKTPGAGGCPDGMKLVAAGGFKIGTAKDDPMMGFDEKPLKSVEVAAYCIDAYEYPNRRGAMPKVNVSWGDAKALCEKNGKRLCSEEEWEKACKGPGNAKFPYGSTFDPNACNTEDEAGEDRTLAAAGRYSRCRSGYGVADLSGNVAEWTSTAYAGNADMTQKGGSFGRPDYAARCSARKNGSPSSRSGEVGFRCCSDAN